MELEFSRQIFEKKKKRWNIKISLKIRPVGAELFHVERRTDVHDEGN